MEDREVGDQGARVKEEAFEVGGGDGGKVAMGCRVVGLCGRLEFVLVLRLVGGGS